MMEHTKFLPAIPCLVVIGGRERFLDCLRSAKGGGGIDGITAAETIIIGSRMVFLAWELHELWEDTLNIRTIDGNLIDYLWRQRMPCVPKKTEELFRPISIASHFVRAWHRLLLHEEFPDMLEGQWGGATGKSVVKATAAWLDSQRRRQDDSGHLARRCRLDTHAAN